MSKKFRTTVCILLAILMLLGIFAGLVGTMGVSAVSQSEIDALEDKRADIRDKQADVKEQLQALQSDMASALEQKTALDEQNELNRQDIEIINEQIEIYDGLIQEKSEELDAAKAAEVAQYERYCERLRAMEENGTWSYIAFVFQATSLSDLLSRLDDITDIVTHDQNLEAQYVAAREEVEVVKAEYETVQEEQKDKRTELEAEKAALEKQIESATAVIADLEGDIDEYTAFYEENELLEAEVQAQIDKKVAELETQQAAILAAQQAAASVGSSSSSSSGSVASSGYYYWPTQSCTYISSKFGYRFHPIFQTTKFHSGVDIAASYGATVSAAAAGTVTIAEYSSSYGNYAVIYHSNGTTTLYAHMSSFAVSAGDTVSQGQTVGYVGSTGNSTGPHLHFEIRVNGSCVDPLSYFSGIAFTYASS